MKTIKTLLSAAALATVALAAAPPAQACGGEWFAEPEIDYRVMGVARAEKSLERGDYDAAAGAIVRMIPHIRNYHGVTRDPIINRAMRVLAVATSRKGGEINDKQLLSYAQDGWQGGAASQRNTNLEWSVNALKALEDKDETEDVLLQAQLAEAMTQVAELRDDGKARLESLAKRDLLVSPEAYRRLASLRAAEGNTRGELAALERCRNMTKDKNLCGAVEGHS
ncbi:MAG: hypothetical protein KC731_07945 [Myxococcales bacterium]|nr:hypothetical protein [Myxococcales bacterium]